jgi:5-methylcytosine-specific restriction endonuclease McrA
MTRRRTCICGRIAEPGRDRCERHRASYGWASKPKIRDAAYADPAYKRNRRIVLGREPWCHWKFPGVCTGRSTTADHLLAVSRGGTNDLSNLVGSCRPCNEARGRDLGNETKRRRR